MVERSLSKARRRHVELYGFDFRIGVEHDLCSGSSDPEYFLGIAVAEPGMIFRTLGGLR